MTRGAGVAGVSDFLLSLWPPGKSCVPNLLNRSVASSMSCASLAFSGLISGSESDEGNGGVVLPDEDEPWGVWN